MNHSTRRFFSLLLSILLIFGAGVVYVGFVQPLYDEIILLRAELAQKEATLASRKDLSKKISDILGQYGSENKAVAQMTAALPESPDIATVLAQLQGVSLDSGVVVNDIGLSEQANVSAGTAAQTRRANVLPLGVLNFSLSISGPYDAIIKMVTSLEQSVRIMDIKSLAMAPEKEDQAAAMKAELKVSAYYQKSLDTAGKK